MKENVGRAVTHEEVEDIVATEMRERKHELFTVELPEFIDEAPDLQGATRRVQVGLR